MKKVLILFAHPAFQKSRVNRAIVQHLADMDGVTFHDLYQVYPEFDIDVAAEQELLLSHDIIIFQHPFYWYSTPSLLKEWQDLVLQHGWAYGSEGTKLTGKLFFSIISAGGRKEAYCDQGYNNFTIRQLLAPLEQTANLCKMIYLPPYMIHGTHSILPEEVETHRREIIQLIKLLQQNEMDLKTAVQLNYLNDLLD